MFNRLREQQFRKELFLLISFFIFLLSIISLRTQAVGARLLVLLPFFSLLGALTFDKILRRIHKPVLKKIFFLLITITYLYQFGEAISWETTRWFPSPMETSSEWIHNNIPQGTTIGLELIPIFEQVPDVLLKDYYSTLYFPNFKSQYSYSIIDSKTTSFPQYVVLSNSGKLARYIADNFKGQKSIIIDRLEKQNYKKIKTFTPNLFYYHLFNNDIAFFNGLEAMPLSISIYKK
jgi:hypothetical protein